MTLSANRWSRPEIVARADRFAQSIASRLPKAMEPGRTAGPNGGGISIPLVSADRREQFVLDLRRGTIDLSKGTYQNRGRQVVVLVRLDFGGAPHRNPDGEEIGSPHLHLYREGYGDKWAVPAPGAHFANLDDPSRTLDDFMRYCNIVEPPVIRRGLFT